MATTKKTTAKAATEDTAVKEAVKETKKTTTAKKAASAETAPVAEKAPAKKAPAKKPAPKKVAPKKPADVAAKTAKPAEKATAPETKVSFFVEFGGVQVSVDEVIKNVKATYGKDAKEISVYLKPDESKAYFVADGEESEMNVYFC